MSLPKNLSILSFNILGIPFVTTHSVKEYLKITRAFRPRMREIGKRLNDSQADVLLLQEVHTFPLLKSLKKALTKYPYVSYKPFIWGPRGGLVIFSKHPIESTEYSDFMNHGSFFNKSFPAKLIQNGILVSKLKNMPLYVLNTYLTSNEKHEWFEKSKDMLLNSLQTQQVCYMVNLLSEMGNEVIIGGDFNMAKHSSSYNEFLENTHMKDLFSHFTTPTQHAVFLPSHIEVPRLDYIFATQKISKIIVDQTEQLFETRLPMHNGRQSFLSDHVALLASISYEQAPKETVQRSPISVSQVIN